MADKRLFTQAQADAVARALGDTEAGLTGPEIGHLFSQCGMDRHDPGAGAAKWKRLQAVFACDQNTRGDRSGILAFIRKAMQPAMHLGNPQRYDLMRHNLNKALLFAELECDEAGRLWAATAATTVSEAERRARSLRSDLKRRGVHPEVLRFCAAEWLADDYFHAVLEATKSVADRIRKRTGLVDDGASLVDRAFGGDRPMLLINSRSTKSERDEQSGFCNLLKGLFGMFRNPTAHEARINWHVTEADAEDLMSLVSLIQRRLDAAVMPSRTQ